jgi:acyl-CoA reductase-like NAD-dependent aldehyde dehydrogenase
MSNRVPVLKTYKTYVGGKFPRSESGKTYPIKDSKDTIVANACRCTRKDVRDAVLAAKSAFSGWQQRSAYNKGQILYRMGEMLEGRKSQFVDELTVLGVKKKYAEAEVEAAIDRFIYYAGWTDKIAQVFGTINPVASQHFNFSSPEPTGVVGIISSEENPLLSVVSLIAPVIAGGNSCVLLAPESNPLPAVSLGEVLLSSDLPGGVVNILSGYHEEMADHLSSHLDVNAIFNATDDKSLAKLFDENASISVKRVKHFKPEDWLSESTEDPYLIQEFMEIKTTWHPIGM